MRGGLTIRIPMIRPRSFALFSLHRVEGKEEQLENYFKYNIRFGVITVILVSIGMFGLSTIFFAVSLDTNGVIIMLVGFCGIFLGAIMAGQLRKASLMVLKDTSLDLSDEQKSAARKGLLFATAAFVIAAVTWIALGIGLIVVLTLETFLVETMPIVLIVLTIITVITQLVWLLVSSNRALKVL